MVSRYLNLTCLRCNTTIPLQWSSSTVRCISFTSSDSAAFDDDEKLGKPRDKATSEKKKEGRKQYLNERIPFQSRERHSIAHRLLVEDKIKHGEIQDTHKKDSFAYKLLMEDKSKHGEIKNVHERKHRGSMKDGTNFKKPFFISPSYEKSVQKAAAKLASSLKDESIAGTLLDTYESSKKYSYTEQSKNTSLNILSIMNKMRTVKATSHEENSNTKTVFKEKLADDQTINEALSDILGKRQDRFKALFSKNIDILTEDPVPLKTWRKLEEKELKLLVTHAPTNGFEEMIQWTDDEKLWKFPIDNEQGMEEEQNVHFSKHVFLEHHLNDWCPKKGPVRHFMELICVGLSKNPYLTVEEKFNHIMWYKDYFAQKQNMLVDLGALEKPITDSPNMIES